MRKYLTSLFSLLVASSSWGAACTSTSFQCSVEYGASASAQGNSSYSACAAAVSAWNANAASSGGSTTRLVLGARQSSTSFAVNTVTGVNGVAQALHNIPSPACEEPPNDAVCAPKMGKDTVINFTEGFTRTSDENDRAAMVRDTVGPVARPPADGKFCNAGCLVAAEISGPNVKPMVSMFPTANGLYRRSLDLPAVNLGTGCTPGSGISPDSQIKPTEPVPACPGFVGTVNGKTVCAGTAAKPVLTTDIGRPDIAAVPGNPAAGERPSSGAGSGSGGAGRTPGTGDGGNAGGPAAAAVGPRGTSSSPAAGTQQDNCGAPGQPKCRLDESGTPSEWEPDELNSHAEKYKADVEAGREKVSGVSDKTMFSGWGAVFFVPPIAECTPFILPREMGSIDPCPVADGMRLVMAWIWAVGGLALCARMIYKVV